MQRTLELVKRQLIRPPSFVAENIHYEVLTGSISYGCSSDSSDEDIVGFCIPSKEILFPHQFAGEIEGFGTQKERFGQFQQHQIKDPSSSKTYDITIYNIVKFFSLCMDNNPNMVDTLYVPQECVVHTTNVGKMVRDNRDLFLHKGSYHKFNGYAYSMLSKLTNKQKATKNILGLLERKNVKELTLDEVKEEMELEYAGSANMKTDLNIHELRSLKEYLESNRLRKIVENNDSFDYKFAYHLVRLVYECEMILSEGTLELQRYKEHYKAIRKGEVSEEEIRKFFADKEVSLRKLYETSTLRHSPDEPKIKQLLLDCLEHHYGSLAAVIQLPDKYRLIVEQIKELVNI